MACSEGTTRKGFSLVELTVVLVVLAMVGAIAFPRWAAAQANYQLQHARQRLERDLLLVQASARAAGADRRVLFNLAANTYELEGVGGSLDGVAVVALDEEPFGAQLIGLTGDDAGAWTFDGYGAFAGGSLTLRVAGVDRVLAVRYTSGAPVQVVLAPSLVQVDDVVARPLELVQ